MAVSNLVVTFSSHNLTVYFLCLNVYIQKMVHSVHCFVNDVSICPAIPQAKHTSKLEKENPSGMCLASWVSGTWWIRVEDDLQ